MSQPSISVVLPTFNCLPLMARHIDAMERWIDLAHEVIVVDSRSTDGTLDLIRSRLRHPRLRIIERDRGLYASWNEGIAATSGRWIYISTAGDTITRDHLSKMVQKAECAQADVVISACGYVDEEGRIAPPTARRNPRIYEEFARRGDVLIAPPAARHFAFRAAGTHALLGSCASDLFRGDFLRARPFPTDYGTHGDTAWLLRHAHEMRLCVLQEVGSTFCLHVPTNEETKESRASVLDRIHSNEITKGGMTPTLASSIRLRALMKLRRSAWRGRSPTLAWIAASLSYLQARLSHGMLESAERRRLHGQITKVS